MAKLHCGKHQRYVPYCDDCKAVVKEAEEQAAREEQSETLQEGVGFPGESDPGGTAEGHGLGDEFAGEKQTEPEGPLPEDDEPGPDNIPDPWADGKTPEVGQDVGHWVPPQERVVHRADIDETAAEGSEEGSGTPRFRVGGDGNIVPILIPGGEESMIDLPPKGCLDCGGECQGHEDGGESDVDLPPLSPEGRAEIKNVIEALESGEARVIVTGDNVIKKACAEGRKEVIKMVREYYADSMDTVAFQLLAYLEKRCR